MRNLFLALTLAVLASPAVAQTAPRTLPVVAAEDLNGRAFAFPSAATGDPSIAVFVYRREEQPEASRVFALASSLQASFPNLQVREFPVIQDPGGIVRGFINSGMRNGIRDSTMRGRTVTLFVRDLDAFRRSTGFTDPRGVWLAVLRDGRIVTSAPSSSIQSAADVRRLFGGG